MMTLDDRIEAAVLSVEREIGGRLSDQARNEFRVRLRLWSRGLFPELFDGTAWLAPVEATRDMTAAGCRSASDDLDPTSAEMGAFYAAMRDAYLEASPTEPE